MNNKIVKYVVYSFFSVSAMSAFAEPESCLDWDVQIFPATAEQSSCSYFNHNKVSTRFMVHNVCDSKVSGVFSYYKEDLDNKAVMSVQSFAVSPGSIQEIANPCDMKSSAAYKVSQVSF